MITPSTIPFSNVTSALIVASLSSNTSSLQNLRPQKRHHRSSSYQVTCPPVKKNVVATSLKVSVNSTSSNFKKKLFDMSANPHLSSKGFILSKRRKVSGLSQLYISTILFLKLRTIFLEERILQDACSYYFMSPAT